MGEILALTWALEAGEPGRFRTMGNAISYCGLTGAQDSSAGQDRRTPISKQRNKHLQAALIEAAKVAPQWNPQLRDVYDRAREGGNANQATLEVARKLVRYLLSADRSRKPFVRRAAASLAGEGSTMAE